MRNRRFMMIAASCAALSLGFAACGDDDDDSASTSAESSNLSGQIAGAGASSQAAGQEAWQAGFQSNNPDATVSYDPVGSGGGREQFVAGGTAFGGTDAAFEGEELAGAQERCGGADNFIEIPAYISPIGIMYNLPGVETLQLSPETLAAIMKGDITTWNDAKIAADNPDVDLPDSRITVVHRSDESGTTENFEEYLSATAPDIWTYEVSGDWPVKGQEAAQGTSGVVDAIGAGEGTIGYADLSQKGDLGVANIKVGEEFVEPSSEAAAKILEASPQDEAEGQYQFTYTLDRKTSASGTYPVVLVSYMMACTQYDDAATADLVKGYLSYIISEDGQNAAAENAGSAPISDSLREKITPAIDAISAGGGTTTTG